MALIGGRFTYKGHQPLIGAGEKQDTAWSIDPLKSYAVISRTNAALFDIAASELDRDVPYCFIGGVEGYKFSVIEDAYYLYAGRNELVRDSYLRRFNSYRDMVIVAKEAKDRELSFLIKLIEKYGESIPSLIERIRARHADVSKEDLDRFQGIFFTTAHKSKGLQFKQVILTDDYAELVNEEGRPIPPDEVDLQEVHIHYVALTRAEEALVMSSMLVDFLKVISRGARISQVSHQPTTTNQSNSYEDSEEFDDEEGEVDQAYLDSMTESHSPVGKSTCYTEVTDIDANGGYENLPESPDMASQIPLNMPIAQRVCCIPTNANQN